MTGVQTQGAPAPGADESLRLLSHAVSGSSGAAAAPARERAPQPPQLSQQQLRGFPLLNRSTPEAVLQQFRQLRGRLLRRCEELPSLSGARTLLVTSPEPGEGKTFVASNLALMLGVAPETRVLLVEANVSRQALRHNFELERCAGLREALQGRDWRDLAWQAPNMQVFVLPDAHDEPLEPGHLHRWLAAIAHEFDWIVMDGPSLEESPEAELLSHVCGLTLVVLRPDATSCRRLASSIGRLSVQRLAGFVFNQPFTGTPRTRSESATSAG